MKDYTNFLWKPENMFEKTNLESMNKNFLGLNYFLFQKLTFRERISIKKNCFNTLEL